MKTRTPDSVDEVVRDFCERVSPGEKPIFLTCKPIPGKVQHCFPVIEERVAKQGGDMVMGWAIWRWPGVLIEAELHAVWRDSEGVLHDIAPRSDGTRRVLFVPDPNATYQGRQVNNVRQALLDAPEIHEFIAAHDDKFEFLNRGELADQYQIVFTPDQQEEFAAIEYRLAVASMALMSKVGPEPQQKQKLVWVSPSKKKRRR